jgi:hypothetical protein
MPEATAPTTTAAPTTSAPAPATEAPTGEPSGARGTAVTRAAALRAKLSQEDGAPAGGETESSEKQSGVVETAPTSAPEAAKSTPASAPAEALSPAMEARRKRLAEVAEKERRNREEAEQKRAMRARDEEFQSLQKRLAEYETRLKETDQVFADEDAFFAAAEKRGLKADKLIERLRTALTDPAAIAKAQAEAGDKAVLSEIDKLRKQLEELNTEREREREESRSRSEAERKTIEFRQKASNAAEYPLTAAILKKEAGEQYLIALANRDIIPHISQDYEVEHLLDQIETHLEYFQAAPGQSPPPTKKKADGDASVPTLSNSVTAGRESMAEEIPLHKLSRAERVRLAKERLAKQ